MLVTSERRDMKIYTGRGDDGLTDLRDMSQVSKASPRIEAYGTVDEVNALVGVVRPLEYEDVEDCLREVQNQLHVVQADFATPEPAEDDPVVTESHVEAVEDWIDEFDAELDPLEQFVLPSGSEPGAKLHHARAVCRRAERRAVELAGTQPEINERAIVYLNRLSDLLFTLARVVNKREGNREEHPTY
ncbi:Cob(I)alamin adenosyltransferase [Halapricum desulfuricans]|uniref:Cob(I)alamin adenosyltransferase n=2 Tax=Halapricum desulfuricans TaxID=2841257 RepID=A0A897NL44_9EURY|nr:Cob(I)alamin adenosyltransferase [Halapricum desulfuricans]